MSQQITTNVSETTSTTKNKKGKNLVVKGERQIYCSFLHVSQDPTTSISQISITFWDRVCEHYNQNQLACKVKQLVKSLETKWGVIKHDITKFIGHYETMVALCESRTSTKDILQKTLELNKSKHIQNQSFFFFALLVFSKKMIINGKFSRRCEEIF
jgi:hypothetical protein